MTKDMPVRSLKFLDRNPPDLPAASVRRVAAEAFGLDGEFTPLVSERDQNFRIRRPDGKEAVLKIANAQEDPAVVDLQTAALLHIERVDPGMPVPRVLRTKSGEVTTWVEGPDGSRHIVRALTYLPGKPLGDVPLTPGLLKNLGAAVARLGLALRGFHHPAARHELLWDLQQIPALRPHAADITDPAARARVEGVLDQSITDVLPAMARLRGQVVHHDANGDNVLVDPEAPEQVVGIIDFGDMIHSALVADPAVSAADLMLEDEPLDAMAALVAGFDGVRPLEAEEIDLLYDLVLARQALTTVIIAWRNKDADGLRYLEDYEPQAHVAIESMLSLGRAKVRSRLRQACRFPPYCPKPGEDGGGADLEGLLARRRRLLGETLELSYQRPLHVVRGEGPWLVDADGNRFLDAYNNVPQVGHAHPHVVRAIGRQAAALNTNTRYLYDSILEYADRLAATLPAGLEACLFVNSGSEANDAAFRMAKEVTGRDGALVMEYAYHGITESIDALSPFEPDRRPVQPHVRTLLSPDPYRGPYRAGEPELAVRYAADAERAITELTTAGHGIAALMIDSGFVSNGIPEVPDGYLQMVADTVRAAGGLVIADEVQVGFGRFGSHFWGFQAHGITPDLVTLGKPIGNGYPLGVVITTHEIREAFGEATGFFSTFGGNPVACAAGNAVLDVIESEGLMERARTTGEHLRQGIRGLMDRHSWIGDVRGRGLLVGVELVADRESRDPAPAETAQVVNHLRDNFVLVGREGPHHNVLKIRPPLAFDRAEADILIAALDQALAAL